MALTYGPDSPAEDEQRIGKGYQQFGLMLAAGTPIAMTAYGVDLKWVVAVSMAILIANIAEAGGRLHDLCIRVRRTNIRLASIEHDAAKAAERLDDIKSNVVGLNWMAAKRTGGLSWDDAE